MSAATFTPGPWAVQGQGYSTQVYAADGRHYNICADIDLNGNPENQANARLIAAAPDLYDALVQCRSVLGTALRDATDPVARRVITRKIEVANAALAKARGEQFTSSVKCPLGCERFCRDVPCQAMQSEVRL
jgi:hypothetical protein